jgi:hypothetical protein
MTELALLVYAALVLTHLRAPAPEVGTPGHLVYRSVAALLECQFRFAPIWNADALITKGVSFHQATRVLTYTPRGSNNEGA